MPPWAPWRALSMVLIVAWARPPAARACPRPCACYVPSEVHCTFRSLASVPAGISPQVERINLGFNSIQALPEASFVGLTKLELLMLHGNNIPSIPDGALRDLGSLQVFKFSYNKLRVITAQTLQGLHSLVRLHVDHNELEFIHPRAFQGLTALRLLHLEGNLLQQLHPGTFSTFSFLGHFLLSSLRHLYLAENHIRSLPDGMLQNMPLLENLYLQGNPWACDCSLRWLLRWDAEAKGVLKCKKDKAYEGGQLCARCSSPEKLHRQELQKLGDVACVKPSIQSPLRHNASSTGEGEQDQDTEGDGQLSLEALQFPPWNVSLNMTDEHGNTVSLVCDIRKPRHLSELHLNQTDSQEIDVNATVALDFECPMTRDKYEKLWKLIAYYSEVPVKLHREVTVTEDPRAAARYRQDANENALYYTGVRAHILAEPAWVTQPSIQLQLNRRQSTAKKVLLSYYAHFSLTTSGKEAGQARGRSWVMIEPAAAGQGAQTVLEGTPCQLSCNVKASESPSIFWVLPDGSVLRGPMEDPHGKFSVLTSGRLRITLTEQSDSGLYQCIAQVRDEMDRAVYRLLVEPPATQPSGRPTVTIQKNPGESLTLPCNALAVPEAQVSWILPDKRMIHHVANASQVYLSPNGTLSIPKVQVSDSGFYRCVAVNQQGSDRFTVGVTVSKRGAGKSSKRGRRPGGKTLPRLRGDVVEDEGGSGRGEEESPARRLLHPKDQETFLKTREDAQTKKGRRKLKPWKNSEKEPESNVAEGRRVFESRRRINMANKQIHPEHWADILARVRGKNLPKGTEGPEAVKSTTPSASLHVTAASPMISPPSVSPAQTVAGAEESSADASFFGEEEQISSTMSSSSTRPERGQTGVSLAAAKATSPDLEEFTDDEFSLKPEDPVSPEAAATTLISFVPSESSPPPHTWAEISEERSGEIAPPGDRSATDIAPVPAPRPHDGQTLLESALPAASEPKTSVTPALEMNPRPGDDTVTTQDSRRAAPTSVSSLGESRTSEPAADFIPGGPSVLPRGHRQEEADTASVARTGWSTQGQPVRKKGAVKDSLVLQRGEVVEGHPPGSGGPNGRGQRVGPTTRLHSTLGGKPSTAALEGPRGTTLGSLLDEATTTVTAPMPPRTATPPPAPTTHSPRKRPNGRRRLRPHKFRQRHKQTPPGTSAPTETFSPPPTQAADAKTPKQVAALLVPASGVEATVGPPTHVEVGTRTEHVTKGSTRRKHGKRPNKHRYSMSAVTSTVFASKPGRTSENQPAHAMTPSPDTSPVPTTVALRTGAPREVTRVADYLTTPLGTPAPRLGLDQTVPATQQSVSDDKEVEDDGVTNIDDDDTDGVVPTESGVNVVSPSDSAVFTMGAFKDAPPPPGSPGPGGWNPPSPAPPGGPHTDTRATTSSENLVDSSPFLKESEDTDHPSAVTPSVAVPAVFHREEGFPSTGVLSTKAESSSQRMAQATQSGQDSYETTTALPGSGNRMENHLRPPAAPGEEPASPPPPTALVAAAQTTTEPAPLTPTASPVSTDPKGHVFFHHVGIPEAGAPPGKTEGTEPAWRTNELPTPSPRGGHIDITPQLGSGKEPRDGRFKNTLPQGPEPHHQDGSVHLFHQPTRLPPRGTVRPLPRTTQSPFRHMVTLQSPRYSTNKPGITAYPSRVLPASKHPTTPRLSSPAPPVGPWHHSRPNDLPDRGAARFNNNPQVFGSNNLPDLRHPVGKLPNARVPHYSDSRLPFLFNRTFSSPQLGGTVRPPTPTSPPPATAERRVNPSPYDRIHSHGISHVDFGPPAPPLWPRPRTMSPPSTNTQGLPRVHPTRSSVPFVTSAGPPSRSFHQSSSKLFSAAGPPASKFWTLGEKPQIVTRSPQTVSVTAEADVMLPCEATGKPKPSVTWTKVSTGALMTPNTRVQRFEVLQNGTFVIRKVQPQDRGQYLCTAKNVHGADRMLVLLSVTVQQPQILASHYQDVTVYLGDTIAMECLAKGTPAPQISWIFPDRRVWQNVSPVEGRVTLHENRTLSIKEASFADRGVYKCVASNAAGADSLAIRLHVAALPPVIQQEKLENISLPPGFSIHIHCSAKAAPLPSVRWVLWDGTQIRPSQFLHGNLFVFPNGTLYIRNLAPKDSGRYECVAANLVGTARRTVQLTVRRAAANARITGTSPQRTNVHYGGTLRLDCSASGDPWPRILWRLPSKRMIDSLFSFDTRVTVFENGTLVVKSVTDRDAGDYLCVARNKVGDDFVLLKVNVVMKPAKIEHKEENDHRVFYGGDLKVDCVASGLPNPEISWSLPDGRLVSSFMQSDDSGGRTKRYVVFNNGTLYFNEVGMREEGDYTCFAENQVGKDEKTVRVKVVTEPAAIQNKTYSVLHVPYGDVVTVACEAKGEPTPRVTWLSPTNRLIPTSSEKYQIYQDGTLLIQKAQRADSGNYTCVVRNSGGEDRKIVWIHVNVRSPTINGNPNAITTVREIAAGGSRKLIDCQAEGVPTPKVLWAFPEGVVLPAPYYGNRVTIHRNGTLDIKRLRTSDSVQLTCIGRNEGGEARLIVQLTVLEPMERPVFHDPVNEKITAMAGHTISLNCSAAGTPAPSLTWVLPNGTELQSGRQLLRFYHKRDGMLHISGLSSGDAGAYRCVARNAAGHTERLVSLKVGLKPELSKQYHNLVSIVNGETLNLQCLSPGGGPARFSWTLPNGVVLQGPQTRGRFALWENGTLTVREASVFDRGTYACKAESDHGPSVMNFPVIVIAYPPRITSEPTPVIYTRPGGTVKMNCMAMGVPKAEITWELPDKSRLTAGRQARAHGHRSLHPQGSLTIQQATQRDAGFYKCTAKNILGTDTKTTYIHVY
ncbi:matrix-remodeling-associated protein 5 [Artibeus jamaicensis]|uniref:matrix-remodeling-associated protein 5 n=1 Tax=Artibeus jamaicensis TaxID=9417 RepID=UPI00235A4A20|nr:matrix-remodeling-associated protein 5 [Artibeus jamaicensis]XP_053529409.1 matrix-remodeling-associated protein 5 [Artibeus jamaicensis]